MPQLEEDFPLRLTKIWENATWGASHVGDAIRSLKHEPSKDIRKDLGDALVLLNKASAKIQQILATRP